MSSTRLIKLKTANNSKQTNRTTKRSKQLYKSKEANVKDSQGQVYQIKFEGDVSSGLANTINQKINTNCGSQSVNEICSPPTLNLVNYRPDDDARIIVNGCWPINSNSSTVDFGKCAEANIKNEYHNSVSNDKLSTGGTIALGTIFGVFALATLGLFCWRRPRRRNHDASLQEALNTKENHIEAQAPESNKSVSI